MRWLIPTCFLLIACSSDEFASGGDAGADTSTATDGGSDTSTVDASPPDAAPADTGCATATLDLPVEADTQIISGSGSGLKYGQANAVAARNDLGIIALFRFDVANLPKGASLVAMSLDLPYVGKADNCVANMACSICDGVEVSGSFNVHFMRSDWDEASVTFANKSTGVAWNPTASPASRSAPVAKFSHTAKTSEKVSIEPAHLVDVADWRQTDKLSVQIEGAAALGSFYMMTKENVCGGQPPNTKVLLHVTYCK